MRRSTRSRLIPAAAAVVALLVAKLATAAPGPVAAPGDTIPIDAATARAGLTFAPGVAGGDRAWVLAAIAGARPEARRLIDAVDGLVRVETAASLPEERIGQAAYDGRRSFVVTLDVGELDGPLVRARDNVVLHELGHVIDRALVPAELGERLDAGIPRSGPCTAPADPTGPCTAPAERFADTFAKWALRGAVSEVGAGYGVPMPPSLEGWGAPLVALSPAS